MNFLISAQLGPNRSVLPNGALLCNAVPIARTGIQLYRNGELLDKNGKPELSDGPQGYIEVERSADEVFNPASIASFNGAAFVDEHPSEWVTPQNWNALSKGIVLNPRRGDGDLSEWLVADIMVTDPRTIQLIDAGKREVSVGYDAEYDEREPGYARQRNIVVNHVALVSQGRCGPSCAIGDSKTEIPEMTAKTAAKSSTAVGLPAIMRELIARTRKAIHSKDEAGVEANLAAAEAATAAAQNTDEGLAAGGTETTAPAQPEHHVHIHMGDDDGDDDNDKKKPGEGGDKSPTKDDDLIAALTARVDGIDASIKAIAESVAKLVDSKEPGATAGGAQTPDENQMSEFRKEAPTGTQDAAMTKDSAFLEQSFQATVSMAEIVMPGIKIPTFDAKANPVHTFGSICGHRRAALNGALAAAAIRPALATYVRDGLGTKTVDKLTCAETRDLFRGAAMLQSALNNGAATMDVKDNLKPAGGQVAGKIKTLADLNAANRQKYYGAEPKAVQ